MNDFWFEFIKHPKAVLINVVVNVIDVVQINVGDHILYLVVVYNGHPWLLEATAELMQGCSQSRFRVKSNCVEG